MTAIARYLNGCSGNAEKRCETGCEPICTGSAFRQGRNGKFYECTSRVLARMHAARSIYADPDLYLFRQVQQFHRAPQHGFTLSLGPFFNISGSCPLTLHPYKDYDRAVLPSFRDCEDVPLVAAPAPEKVRKYVGGSVLKV
jgi:hypothetical protein